MKPRYLVKGALGAALLALASHVNAAVITTGSASGHGVKVDLSAAGLLTFQVGPVPDAAVNSPAPGSDSGSLLSLSESAALGDITAQNGGDNALVVNATTNVTGAQPSGNANADATVNGLALTVVPAVLLNPDLLSITSTTLSSESDSSGTYGALVSTGTCVFENLEITVAGVSITVPVNPAPNYSLDLSGTGVDGLSIILNEQIAGGDGIGSTSLTTNALHVYFDEVSFGTVSALSGDIVISSSSSALNSIPEPGAAALLGLVPILALRRRRHVR